MAKKKTIKDFSALAFPKLSSLIKWLWIIIVSGILFTAAFFVLISYTKMPDTEELENPDLEASTIILSSDKREISRFYSKNREIVEFEQLNPHLVEALISTEDERFFGHSGIDARGTLRAVINLSRKGGGSTITQQLAKQFFTKGSRSFVKRVWQKLQEWVIAVEFERRYTKEEILAMYLNKFEFNYQSFGISAAAKNYFDKNQSELGIDEAAILIGMLKSPTYYNPKNHPENALRRRNVVMYQMVRNGFLSTDEYETLKEKAIDMSHFKRPVYYDGMAPYFKSTLKKYLKKILEQDKYKKPDGTTYDPNEDGLKIYTTLDYDMQIYAEETMLQHMEKLQEKYFNKWANLDPWKYAEADANKEKQLAYRKEFLTRVMKETERFQKLRNAYMLDVFNAIKAKYPDAQLLESDIQRMLKEEESPGYLKELIRKSVLSLESAKNYRNILKDELWIKLKTQRKALLTRVKTVFNSKTKMKVFAYNAAGEKEVFMTPLDSIKYHMEHLQIGSVAIDPSTGYIKTWVGGINNKYFKIDHVLTDNQVGSTFKTFLYTTAISQFAMSPCVKVLDIRHEIPAGESDFGLMKTWAPDNSDGKFTEEYYTLKEGLKRSKNSVSVWLVKQLRGVALLRNLVNELGIDKNKIPNAPSIILGTPDLNVLEMTAAYATFANNGVYNEPTFITKIEDSNGKVIYNYIPTQRRVLNEKYNYATVNLLEYATEDLSYALNSQFGGKTGTTNDHVDGWFMGISPDLVVGTWVGGENSWIRFLNLRDGSGGAMARPYYFEFMKRLETKSLVDTKKRFFIPEGDLINFDCDLHEAQRLPSKEEKDRDKKIKELNDDFVEEFEG
jgi:penicillin-binding protein 1A